MKMTYDKIINEMKNTYFDTCGERLTDGSPVLKRLEAAASEIYALFCYGDYIFKQAFVQSATGDSLDAHAELRGLERKSASCATGELTFYLGEEGAENIFIPKGTICSVNGKPYLQYATTMNAIIEAGRMSISIPAASIGNGQEYNVGDGEITVMVNAPASVTGVINADAFTGGTDDECDLSLRNRIISVYSAYNNGINCSFIANVICNLDFVLDCFVSSGNAGGEVVVVVKTKTGMLSISDINRIKNAVGIDTAVGGYVTVAIAQPQDYSMVIEANIRSGFNKNDVEAEVEHLTREICSSLKIGEALELNKISKALVGVEGLSDFNVHSNNSLGGVINCGSRQFLQLNDLVVNCFGE